MGKTSADYNADSESVAHDDDALSSPPLDEVQPSVSSNSSPFESSIPGWPLPYTIYPPICSPLLWDEYGKREIYVMCEFTMDDVDTGVPKRTALYSTVSPPGLFETVDHGAIGEPPHAAGKPYNPEETWPRYDPTWLYISSDNVNLMRDIETKYRKCPEPYVDAHNLKIEIEAQELFRRQPTTHPNMPVYLGCEVDAGWVVSVVFHRYSRTLHNAIESGQRLDIPNIMAQLEDVVTYLHSLGVAHNDINPWNVMLTDDLRLILIDYDTCLPAGALLIDKRGTPGFNENGAWTTSAFWNDEHGLRCVEDWLKAHIQAQ